MRHRTQWRWHPNEVFVQIKGELHYLWRAVDQEGEVLEAFVTKKRDKSAALKFLRKVMKRYGSPHVVVTDKCGLAFTSAFGMLRRRGPYSSDIKLCGSHAKAQTHGP